MSDAQTSPTPSDLEDPQLLTIPHAAAALGLSRKARQRAVSVRAPRHTEGAPLGLAAR